MIIAYWFQPPSRPLLLWLLLYQYTYEAGWTNDWQCKWLRSTDGPAQHIRTRFPSIAVNRGRNIFRQIIFPLKTDCAQKRADRNRFDVVHLPQWVTGASYLNEEATCYGLMVRDGGDRFMLRERLSEGSNEMQPI